MLSLGACATPQQASDGQVSAAQQASNAAARAEAAARAAENAAKKAKASASKSNRIYTESLQK
jgi:hypothetical protein